MPIGVLGDRLRPRSQTVAEGSARVIARRSAILLIAAVLLKAGQLAHAGHVLGALEFEETPGVVVEHEGDDGLGEDVGLDVAGRGDRGQ